MYLSERSGVGLVRSMVKTREMLNPPRPPGLHLSDVVQSLIRTLRLAKTYTNDHDEENDLQPMFWEMGCVWEDTVTLTLHRLYPSSYRPIPRQQDGIWCSPDWFRPIYHSTIDEIKLTWTKHTDITSPKIQAYLWQLKAYMYVWNATRGCLHVGYVRGNYADHPVDCRQYIVRCTRKELKEHWEDLLAHARDTGMFSGGKYLGAEGVND